MGELAKAVRWSAPGSVFLLMAAITLTSSEAAARAWSPTGGAGLEVASASPSAVALAALSAVPIGFVTYQIYYYGYSSSRGFAFSFVHLDVALAVRQAGNQIEDLTELPDWTVKQTRGLFLRWPFHARVPFTGGLVKTLWLYRVTSPEAREADPALAPGEVPTALRTDVPLRARDRRRNELLESYSDRRENNWLELESQLHSRLREREAPERDFKDIERLADIFHTLGATKSAVTFGWFAAALGWVYALATGYRGDWTVFGFASAGSLLPSLAVAAWMYVVLHRNRGHCQRRRIAMIRTARRLSSTPEPRPSEAER